MNSVSSGPTVGIVGAGVSGLSAAYELTRRGIAKVSVLDRGSVASGSSGLSIGLIETQYMTELDVALRALSMRSFDALAAQHGLAIVRNGYLRLAAGAADLEAFRRSVEIQAQFGLDHARVLSPEEISDLVPGIYVGDLAGGLWGPRDGYVDGYLYASLLAELCQEGGAELVLGTRVEGAARGSRRRHRLSTSRGEMEFDFVVNAAGAWGAKVAGLCGTRLDLVPQRHQVLTVHLPRARDDLMPSVIDYSPGSHREGLYFRHEREDQLLAGLHCEEVVGEPADADDWFSGIDDAFVETVAELLAHRLPGFADASLGAGWAGLYPVSPDGLPQVGPCREDETVIAACGVGGFGIQVAPMVGALVADWIVYGEGRSLAQSAALLPGRYLAAPGAGDVQARGGD